MIVKFPGIKPHIKIHPIKNWEVAEVFLCFMVYWI